jgi:hypothetical protein
MSSTSIRASRGVACTPDASKQELSRTAVVPSDTPSFIKQVFGAWLSRAGSPNKKA